MKSDKYCMSQTAANIGLTEMVFASLDNLWTATFSQTGERVQFVETSKNITSVYFTR